MGTSTMHTCTVRALKKKVKERDGANKNEVDTKMAKSNR